MEAGRKEGEEAGEKGDDICLNITEVPQFWLNLGKNVKPSSKLQDCLWKNMRTLCQQSQAEQAGCRGCLSRDFIWLGFLQSCYSAIFNSNNLHLHL